MGVEDKLFINMPQISAEEQQKYRGMNVALVDGKVVAAGYTSIEAVRKAMELFPDKSTSDILIAHIPSEDLLIV